MSDPRTLGLHDIVLPDPVGFWPPPWSFWLLPGALLVLACLCWLFLRPLLRRWRRQRRALAAWRNLRQSCSHPEELSAALNRLLKTVLVAAGQSQVACLSGTAWRVCLKTLIPPADHTLLDSFLDSLYRPRSDCDRRALERAAPRWLRRLA